MNVFKRIFGWGAAEKSAAPATYTAGDRIPTVADAWRVNQVMQMIDGLARPTVAGSNYMEMYRSIPEVFWPIDYIAKRISEANFVLRRDKDDTVEWHSRSGADRITTSPNPVMGWRELVYSHFVYKLATGNAFMRAAMPETMDADAPKWRWCSNYWELPADKTGVEAADGGYGAMLFGTAGREEIVKGYRLGLGTYSTALLPPWQVWHDRDGLPCLDGSAPFLKARSRLASVARPIANLVAVYEARNVIYVKRGALGFIVSTKSDSTGTVALEKEEKDEIREQLNATYGLAEGQSPYGFTDIPTSFVRTNLSIAELQPFEETLEDAIKIAGAYGIPSVLVPRKDQSTFSNQEAAEKSVYSSVVIPMCKRFCDELTLFLGLDRSKLWLDCDFSGVACLQSGRKEAEEVRKLKLDTGLAAFKAGLCTLDDIRAQMGESQLAARLPLYGKLTTEMTPEERRAVNINQQQETPKGESDERTDEEPPVQHEGD